MITKLLHILFEKNLNLIYENKSKYLVYQSHDIIYIHHEFNIKRNLINLQKKVEVKEIKWYLENGGTLLRSDFSPPIGNLSEHNLFINCKKLSLNENILHLDTQINFPINLVLEANMLNESLSKNNQKTDLEIRNKRDWEIRHIKLKIAIQDTAGIKSIEIIDTSNNMLKGIFYKNDLEEISWRDNFKGNETKIYQIRMSFEADNAIHKIIPYLNGEKVRQVISLYPEEPLDCLNKALGLIKSMKGNILWEEKQLDPATIREYIQELDTSKCNSLRILCGPIKVDDKFKSIFKLLKKDFELKNIKVECRVVLDDSLLKKLHDRFLYDDSSIWSMPPGNLITCTLSTFSNVTTEVGIKTALEKIWLQSSDIINNWEKIKSKRDLLKKSEGY